MTEAPAVLPSIARPNAAAEPAIVALLLSSAKTVRQLVGLKLAEHGIMAGQDQFLLSFDGTTSRPVNEVAEALSVRASTVSKMGDIMERKGWAVRTPDPKDGRRTLIGLTANGRTAADNVRIVHRELDDELTGAIGDDPGMTEALAKMDATLARRLRRLR